MATCSASMADGRVPKGVHCVQLVSGNNRIRSAQPRFKDGYTPSMKSPCVDTGTWEKVTFVCPKCRWNLRRRTQVCENRQGKVASKTGREK